MVKQARVTTRPRGGLRLISFENIDDIPGEWQTQLEKVVQETKESNAKWHDSHTVNAYITIDIELKSGNRVFGKAGNGRSFVKFSKDLISTDNVIGAVVQKAIGVSFI